MEDNKELNAVIQHIEMKLKGLELYANWEALLEYKKNHKMSSRSKKTDIVIEALLGALEMTLKEQFSSEDMRLILEDIKAIAYLKNRLLRRCGNTRCKKYVLGTSEHFCYECLEKRKNRKEPIEHNKLLPRKVFNELFKQYKEHMDNGDFESIREMRLKYGYDEIDEVRVRWKRKYS